MCTCIDNIKASYTEVKKVATRVSKESFAGPIGIKGNIQPNIDEFLDAINYFTREIHGLTNAINNLVEVTRINFCNISEDLAKEMLSQSDSMCKKMRLLHKKLLASPLYLGMETVVALYCDAMNDFEELCSDIKTLRIDAPNNQQLQKTLVGLDELLNKPVDDVGTNGNSPMVMWPPCLHSPFVGNDLK